MGCFTNPVFDVNIALRDAVLATPQKSGNLELVIAHLARDAPKGVAQCTRRDTVDSGGDAESDQHIGQAPAAAGLACSEDVRDVLNAISEQLGLRRGSSGRLQTSLTHANSCFRDASAVKFRP